MVNNVWRNFISKPKLSHSITNIGEVGYSHYGPTFAVGGTLSAVNAVVLIHNICAEVSTKKWPTAHYMDWFAFRPANYTMGQFSGLALTMASKFTVAPNHPQGQNTLFIDANRFSEMKSVLSAIKDTWETAVATAKRNGPVNYGNLFAEFKELKVITGSIERLKQMNYWEPGEYQVKIRVTTENPKQIFDTKKVFTLTEKEAQLLLDNVPSIVGNICQQPQVAYQCATPILITKN